MAEPLPTQETERLPGEPPPSFLLGWGTSGQLEGQFNDPAAITVDATGNIWVAETSGHRIQKFDNSGTFLLMWGWGVDDGSSSFQVCTSGCETGISGSGDGQLNNPSGLAVDASGNVYVADDGNHRIQKFDSSGTFLRTWGRGVDTGAGGFEICTSGCQAGSTGAGDGEFNRPRDVVLDSAGWILVVDSSNDRVQRFAGDGTFLAKWGTTGTGSGQFDLPINAAVDRDGNVFVAEAGNHRIQKFDDGGISLGAWGSLGSGDGQFDLPQGVGVDSAGHVYVADFNNDRIQKFDGNGVFQVQWGTTGSGNGQFSGPIGLAADESGSIFIVDDGNSRIQKFGQTHETVVYLRGWGRFGTGASQFSYPHGLALDSNSNVYVADTTNRRMQKFDSSGNLLLMWGWGVQDGTSAFQKCTTGCQVGLYGSGVGQFGFAKGIMVDKFDNVYVSDLDWSRIQKFSSSGTYLSTIGSSGGAEGQFYYPLGMASDSAGNLYVVDEYNQRIQKFSSTGTFIEMAGWGVQDGSPALQTCTSGCQAGSSGSGDGQFHNPWGIAIDSGGNIIVSDGVNSRIQKFSSSWGLLAKWGTFCDVAVSGIDSCDGLFRNPLGVAVDVQDNIYVNDATNHRVQKFDNDGTYLTRWGDHGNAGGQLDTPRGLGVDRLGSVYVVDSLNHRIQVFGGCNLSLLPGSGSIAFGGGADGFTIDANSNVCSSTATSNDLWISVTSGASGLGDYVVEYAVTPNPVAVSRAGTITIADGTTGGAGNTFTVVQAPAPCTYTLVPTSATFSGVAGIDFLNVTSLLGCSWTAASNNSWITVTTGTPGNGSGAVLYSVDANPMSTARIGTMTIGGQTFTVTQDPQVPVSPANLVASAVSSTKISLSWDNIATNETEVHVERKLGAAGTFVQILNLPPSSSGVIDSPVNTGTTYFYRVLACNSAGCSAPTAEVSVTTPTFTMFIGETEGVGER